MTNRKKIIAMAVLVALSQSPKLLDGVELPKFGTAAMASIDQSKQFELLCDMVGQRVLESERLRTSGQLYDFWHVASELAFDGLDIESAVQADIDRVWPDIRKALEIGELQVDLDERARVIVAEILAKRIKD